MQNATRTQRERPKTAFDPQEELAQICVDEDIVRRETRLRALAESEAEVKPEAALEIAFGLPPGEIRDAFIRELCQAWARKDAGKALAWSDTLGESVRARIRALICMEVAVSDSRRALELAIEHGSDQGRDGLLENLAVLWADREPAAAFDWVKDQAESGWHDRLLARVAFVLSKSDPRSAACWVAEDMAPGPVQTEAVISVLNQWRLSDPIEAAAWVESFPAGQLRERALSELAGASK
ncbi:hypothetical protein llg_42500 [Luteolibacter sp. LG18]|nr:hypothetical protein llg_42500 [Luteolibacter sp. LG18]